MFKKQLFYMSLETSIHYKNDDDKLIEIGYWINFIDWAEALNQWCEKKTMMNLNQKNSKTLLNLHINIYLFLKRYIVT